MWQIYGEKETCGTKGGLVSGWKQSMKSVSIIDKQYDIMQLNVTLFKYTNEILGVQNLQVNAYSAKTARYQWEKPIRSLGVRGAELTLDHAYEQLDIFCDYTRREKQEKADAAVDEIRKRFGYFSIQRGLMYQDKLLSSLDAKGSHTVHPQGYFS